MKKIVMLIVIGGTLFGSEFQDGFMAYKSRNYTKAINLFTNSCENGVAASCNALGYMYSRGEGVTQNEMKANEIFQKACDLGLSAGCRNLERPLGRKTLM